MKHPFISDLSDKSLEDLQTTLSDLSSKLIFAHRMQNQPLVQQLNMVMESYREEYSKKMDELVKKQNMQGKINISKD